MRAIVTSTITFGLVAIPVKVYAAASSNAVSFNLLSSKNGARLKQQLVDPITEEVVARNDAVKGYEFAKDQFVTFTDEELKKLEAKGEKTMAIKEFVDEASVTPLHVEKSYFLGPNKGGDKGYALLSKALKDLGQVAIAKWMNRSKEHLVAIRSHEGGLIIQQLFYGAELRDFSQIDRIPVALSKEEEQMASQLVKKMARGSFDVSKFEDGFAKRVAAAVEEKVQGNCVTVAVDAPTSTSVLDLFAALKASVEGKEAPKAKETQAPAKKARKPRSKK